MSDYRDPLLEQNGLIGIVLNDGKAMLNCSRWINQQYRSGGGGQLRCPLPCPPSFQILDEVSFGYWQGEYQRLKHGSFCVFGTARFASEAIECCYNVFSGFLVDTPGPGAGRAHTYHPDEDREGFEEEEAAYRACCDSLQSSSESCQLFYSLRPPCQSNDWELFRPDLGESISIISFYSFSSLGGQIREIIRAVF